MQKESIHLLLKIHKQLHFASFGRRWWVFWQLYRSNIPCWSIGVDVLSEHKWNHFIFSQILFRISLLRPVLVEWKFLGDELFAASRYYWKYLISGGRGGRHDDVTDCNWKGESKRCFHHWRNHLPRPITTAPVSFQTSKASSHQCVNRISLHLILFNFLVFK